MQRIGGGIALAFNGEIQNAKGNVTYRLSEPKREVVTGADGIHGYKETAQAGYIEGEITDRGALRLKSLMAITDGTVTLTLGNGKIIVGRQMCWTSEGVGNSEEGNIGFRFEGFVEEVA